MDDIVVKTKDKATLVQDLEETFANLRKINLKLNPEKCVFGVPSGKLLGFCVSQRGIEANPEKIKAIEQIEAPKRIKDVRRLTGCVAALSRFISKSAVRALPFLKILKKGRARSADLEMNLLREATQPASLRTSLTRFGASICSMALILSGFASIPRCDTKNLRSLLDGTPKIHFSGLSLRLILQKFANVSSKSCTSVALSFVLTTMSSM